jgi:hypothetical protein
MTCPPCTHNCEQGKTCSARNKDEIIEMAREADLLCWAMNDLEKKLEAFAKLVAAKEREKWSEVEAYLIAASEGSMSRNNSEALANELLTAIRARG